ncbi:MAG: CoA-transferase, partial [Spirochaetaceae bacterium]|nr:CoA-transferase [Spirochaetaceae bacterium]
MIEYVENKEIIAKRIARIFKNGDVVNLGIGLPTLVANYIPREVSIVLQSENGMLGLGPAPEKGKEHKDLVNAGGAAVTVLPGGCFFDSATSFGIFDEGPGGKAIALKLFGEDRFTLATAADELKE